LNLDSIAGNWKQFKRRARRQWGRLAEDDPAVAAAREASRKQLAEWVAGQHHVDPIHK
jgi:hypothetical protein